MPEDSPSSSAASSPRPQLVPRTKAFQGRQRGYDAFYPSPSTCVSAISHLCSVRTSYWNISIARLVGEIYSMDLQHISGTACFYRAFYRPHPALTL